MSFVQHYRVRKWFEYNLKFLKVNVQTQPYYFYLLLQIRISFKNKEDFFYSTMNKNNVKKLNIAISNKEIINIH